MPATRQATDRRNPFTSRSRVMNSLDHPDRGEKYSANRSMAETFKGVFPFLASDLLRILLLRFVPSVCLVLSHAVGG